MKAIIIMFNRLTWPKKLAEFLSDTGCEVVLADNGSTYPPLLEWYKTCPYQVIVPGNHGGQSLWLCNVVGNFWPDIKNYIVTDHDLDVSSIPHDYVSFMKNELDTNKGITKVGLSLQIDDLPKNPYTDMVLDCETKFWDRTNERGFYDAPVDTTFAMYDATRPFAPFSPEFYSAVRTPKPYVARHLPWYTDKSWFIDNEEEIFYYQASGINRTLKEFDIKFRETFHL